MNTATIFFQIFPHKHFFFGLHKKKVLPMCYRGGQPVVSGGFEWWLAVRAILCRGFWCTILASLQASRILLRHITRRCATLSFSGWVHWVCSRSEPLLCVPSTLRCPVIVCVFSICKFFSPLSDCFFVSENNVRGEWHTSALVFFSKKKKKKKAHREYAVRTVFKDWWCSRY